MFESTNEKNYFKLIVLLINIHLPPRLKKEHKSVNAIIYTVNVQQLGNQIVIFFIKIFETKLWEKSESLILIALISLPIFQKV